MIDQWLKRLSDVLDPEAFAKGAAGFADVSGIDAIERVSAVLLVEIARADHDVGEAELDAIKAALQKSSTTLTAEDIDEITALALQEADQAVSLHEQVRVINSSCDLAQKSQLVEHMWRVAMADGNLDKYEEYSIRKLCDLLHVRHREYMQAKHRVLDAG